MSDPVELAPGYDHLYNPDPLNGRMFGAYVGAKAIIKERRDDSLGFPQVYIEWDKEDWRYKGMPDGWTFEEHFRPVEQAVYKSQDNSDLIIKDLLRRAEDSRICPDCGEIHAEEEEATAQFIDKLLSASMEIEQADAFAVITVNERSDTASSGPYVVFDGKVISEAHSEEAQQALEGQIVRIAKLLGGADEPRW